MGGRKQVERGERADVGSYGNRRIERSRGKSGPKRLKEAGVKKEAGVIQVEERSRKERGEIAETAFLAKAVSMGFGVAKPWGERGRYDFIVDTRERLCRVQVKSAHRASAEGGYTIHAHGNDGRRPYTKAEIDVLVAYVVPEDIWYVVPVEAFQEFTSMKLFPSSKRRRSRHEQYREAWCWLACGVDGVEPKCALRARCGVEG